MKELCLFFRKVNEMTQLMIIEEFFEVKGNLICVTGKHKFDVESINYLLGLIGKKVQIKSKSGIELETLIYDVEARPVCFGPPEKINLVFCFKEGIDKLKREKESEIFLID